MSSAYSALTDITHTLNSPDIQAPDLEIGIDRSNTLQLTIPLIAAENSNVTALRILHAINDKTDSIDWKNGQEIGVAFGALLCAASSACTGLYFSTNIVEGFFPTAAPLSKTISTWIIATPAILAQFSFSLNSNLTLGIKVKRYINRLSKKELWQQKNKIAAPLAVVLPTIFGSIVMGKNAFQGSDDGLIWTICAFRALASLGANMDFYLQRKKNTKGHKDIPAIRLILDAQKRLNNLAQSNSADYIQTLSRHQIIKFICDRDTDNPQAQLENVLNSLFDAFPSGAQISAPHSESSSIKYVSLFLGGLVSLINWKAATKVPALCGLNVPTDLTEVYRDPSWLYSPGFLLGAIILGIPSAYVNMAINSIACSRLFNALKKIGNNVHSQGFSHYFASFTWQNWIVLLLGLTTFSIGYGLSNGGSGYLYPFIDTVKVPNGILATIVCTAIGFMSLDSSLNQASNVYNRQLLEDFIAHENPEAFFNDLLPEKQQKLVILINTFSNLVFDSLLDDFNALDTDTIEKIFSAQFLDKLKQRFHPSIPVAVSSAAQPVLIPSQPALINSAQPSQMGIFSQSHSVPLSIPLHSGHLPRNISTDKLNAPPEFREQISPAPSPHLRIFSRSLPRILEDSTAIKPPHRYRSTSP